MIVRQIGIDVEVEQVEVTSDGSLAPYKASTMREFIPGLRSYYFVLEGERLFELFESQAEALSAALRNKEER